MQEDKLPMQPKRSTRLKAIIDTLERGLVERGDSVRMSFVTPATSSAS